MMRLFILQTFKTSEFRYDTNVEQLFFTPEFQDIATILQLLVGRRVSVRGTVIDVSINKMMVKVTSLLVQL